VALPIELVGWHLCRGDAVLRDADIARITALNNDVASFAIECNSQRGGLQEFKAEKTGFACPIRWRCACARSLDW